MLFCCKEIDKEEKQQLDTETKVINYSELNLELVYKIKIYNDILIVHLVTTHIRAGSEKFKNSSKLKR